LSPLPQEKEGAGAAGTSRILVSGTEWTPSVTFHTIFPKFIKPTREFMREGKPLIFMKNWPF
jgi:hypothetical protein